MQHSYLNVDNCSSNPSNDSFLSSMVINWIVIGAFILLSYLKINDLIEHRFARLEALVNSNFNRLIFQQQEEETETAEAVEVETDETEISDADLIDHVRKVEVAQHTDKTPVKSLDKSLDKPEVKPKLAEEQEALQALMAALVGKHTDVPHGPVSARDELGKGQAGLELMADKLVRITQGMAQKLEHHLMLNLPKKMNGLRFYTKCQNL